MASAPARIKQSRIARPAPRARRRSRRLTEKHIYGIAAVITVIALWELVAALRLKPAIVLPGPVDVVSAFRDLFSTGDIWVDLSTSGRELALGLGAAIVVGLPMGLLVGWYRRLSYVVDPFVNFLNATPRIALTPLLIVWLGIGMSSKVAIIFLMSVLPILINTASGVASLDVTFIRVAKCFGASDLQIFRTVALPATVPFIVSGLRLAVGHALIGVFVAELVGAQHGVGIMMSTAGQQFQTSVVFVGLFIFAITGVVLSALLFRVEKHFANWRPSAD